MQRRLNLACALLHAPRVLLLDEPTVGVDPQSRERIFAAVRAQAAAGAAVLYSTHYMEEAERLCDRVVLIDRGRVVAAGTPAELVRQGRAQPAPRRGHAPRRSPPAGSTASTARAPLRADETGRRARRPRRRGARWPSTTSPPPPASSNAPPPRGGEVMEFHLHQPSLQDVFIELTGRDLRD